jgi:hypothetical protein
MKLAIPMSILAKVSIYYDHRSVQDTKPWNKKADLDAIFAEAERDGWKTEACSGTFWFKKASGKTKCILMTMEENKATHTTKVDMKRVAISRMHKSETVELIVGAMKAHDKTHPNAPKYLKGC